VSDATRSNTGIAGTSRSRTPEKIFTKIDKKQDQGLVAGAEAI